MLDFRVVIAACIAGVVILFGGFGLVASFNIAREPVRPASRIVERPRIEPNASLPVVIETPAVKPAQAPDVVRTPEPLPIPVPVIVPEPAPAPVVPPVEARAPEPAPVAPPVEARAPAPALVQPAPVETTGAIAPKPVRAIPAPAIPAAISPAPANPAPTRPAPATADLPTTLPVEHPQATSGLPPSRAVAKKTPRRPRPAAPPAAAPTNPFSAIFGGFTNQ